MSNFVETETLPETGCTREDIYSLLRTMNPQTDLVDAGTMEVLSNKLYVNLNIPRWKKYTVTHTQLQAAALTNDIELFILPAAGVIHAVKMKHSVKFEGTAITDYKLSVGIAGTLNKYLAAYDVDNTVNDTTFSFGATAGAETHDAGGKSIRLAATSVGANLSASTAGSVDVWVLYSATLT